MENIVEKIEGNFCIHYCLDIWGIQILKAVFCKFFQSRQVKNFVGKEFITNLIIRDTHLTLFNQQN